MAVVAAVEVMGVALMLLAMSKGTGPIANHAATTLNTPNRNKSLVRLLRRFAPTRKKSRGHCQNNW